MSVNVLLNLLNEVGKRDIFYRLCLGYICLTTSIRCPYDVQITVSVRPPQGDLAIIVRIYGHRGLYDFVCLTPHNNKFENIVSP